jgi:hypothetical protein
MPHLDTLNLSPMEVSVNYPIADYPLHPIATNPLEGVVPPGLGRVKSFVIDNEPRTRILYYCYFKYFIDLRYRIDDN